MKEIRIAGLHPYWNSAEAIARVLRINPAQHDMIFVLDYEHPDYVLVPNQFYTDKKTYDRYVELTNCKSISKRGG